MTSSNTPIDQLRVLAAKRLDAFALDNEPPYDREAAIERWTQRMITVGDIPDEILEAMPEVSRSNDPQISPQAYECGCVAVLRITDRDGRTWCGHDEKPFEMRLAVPCDGASCELALLRGRRVDGLSADSITDTQIRALRDRFSEGKRFWDPVIIHECDLALGEVESDDDVDVAPRQHAARARCAEIFQAHSIKETP